MLAIQAVQAEKQSRQSDLSGNGKSVRDLITKEDLRREKLRPSFGVTQALVHSNKNYFKYDHVKYGDSKVTENELEDCANKKKAFDKKQLFLQLILDKSSHVKPIVGKDFVKNTSDNMKHVLTRVLAENRIENLNKTGSIS